MHLRRQILREPGSPFNRRIPPPTEESIQGGVRCHHHGHGQPDKSSYKSMEMWGRKRQLKSDSHSVLFLRLPETKGEWKSPVNVSR